MNKNIILATTLIFILLLPVVGCADDGEGGSTWLKVLGDAISMIVTLVIVPGLLWLGSLLKNLIEEKTTSDILKRALIKTNQVVFGVVSELSQELADAFKAAAADGKLTDMEKAKLKALALDRAKTLLLGSTWEALKSEFGGNNGAENYISGEIEKAVRSTNVVTKKKV